MIQLKSNAIVLRRVDYGEADRVVTFITDKYGLISVMAKGVRKQGSKLASGIELLAENQISFIKGKVELDHLTSARMATQFVKILDEYEKVEIAYELIKLTESVARHFTDREYYQLLLDALKGLNSQNIAMEVVRGWFKLNLLRILGQQPDLLNDTSGEQLKPGLKYSLDIEAGALVVNNQGVMSENTIKAWRALLTTSLKRVSAIGGLEEEIKDSLVLIGDLLEYHKP